MGVHRSPSQLSAAQKRKLRRSIDLIKALGPQIKTLAERKSDSLLTGNVSTKTLDALGHPYARRRFARRGRRVSGYPLPRLPINKQTGRLLQSRATSVSFAPAAAEVAMSFSAPYARYILSPTGTRFMVARPYKRTMAAWGRTEMRRLVKVSTITLRAVMTS